MVAAIRCSFSGVSFVFRKPLSQIQRSTFLPPQHAATLIFSVDRGLDLSARSTRCGWSLSPSSRTVRSSDELLSGTVLFVPWVL